MSFYDQGYRFASTTRKAGSGFRWLAHRRRGTELDDRRAGQSVQRDRGVQGRVPLHRVGPAQRQRGQSSGPLEIDRPWDAYTDDHLGVMDHLGIDSSW
jgi:hypothetical protein